MANFVGHKRMGRWLNELASSWR